MFVNAELHTLADDATSDYVDIGKDNQGYCRCDITFPPLAGYTRNISHPGKYIQDDCDPDVNLLTNADVNCACENSDHLAPAPLLSV